MGREHVPNINEEAPFKFEELFFSRTDDRGIILAGNSVFQRISQYEWDELINKPHNLIRHPDMPKAVFYLLWDTIKKGNPIGAYVKNKAKDGRYYWVFAVVTPIDGGYLSVRLKPSSAFFPIVEEEYKKLVEKEVREKLSPAESGAILMARLNELGFSDYVEFMATALSHEIDSRNENLNLPNDKTTSLFNNVTKSSKSLLEQAKIIFQAYAKNQYVPLNLQIQSAQLGEMGSTIAVISSNYNVISGQIKENMDNFMASAKQVFDKINTGLFLTCTAKIQSEVIDFFKDEENAENKEREINLLKNQQDSYNKKAIDGLTEIMAQTASFQQDCAEMKKLALSLEVTRIMGKVESSRLKVAKDGLQELISDLELFQNAISDGLKEIEEMNKNIQFGAKRLMKSN